jgi:hypothetical protein
LVETIERGFARLSQNIPVDPLNVNYEEAMRDLLNDVLNSTNLCCYLTVSASARVLVVHSLRKFSAEFGVLSAFQGTIMGFLGETIGENMPLFIQAPTAAREQNFMFAFGLEDMAVPTDAQVMAYYTAAGAGNLLNPIVGTVANTIRLACIPNAWATYFLESQTPFEAWKLGCKLVATLDTANERDQARPLTNWLLAACVKRGIAAPDCHFSCLDVSWAALAPGTKVTRWAAARLAPHKKAVVAPLPPTSSVPLMLAMAMAAGATVASVAAREYTPLERQKIQLATTLTPDIYEAKMPKVFIQM